MVLVRVQNVPKQLPERQSREFAMAGPQTDTERILAK